MKPQLNIDKKWLIIVSQFVFFLLILLFFIPSLNFVYSIIIIFLQTIGMAFILFWKKDKIFYIIWEVQLFVGLFGNVLFLQSELETISFLTVFGLFIGIFILVFLYTLFGERSIKTILIILSTSTTIAVFLIVTFVASEGIPAFQENDPVAFLTGSIFNPFYSEAHEEHYIFTTTVKNYDFEINPREKNNYVPSNQEENITVELHNTGGKSINISFSTQTSDPIDITDYPESINLSVNEYKTVNFTVLITDEKNYSFDLIAESVESDIVRTIQINIIGSKYGVDLFLPNKIIYSDESNSVTITTPIYISNHGILSDTYTIKIDAPSYFHPKINGIDNSWDFDNSSGIINLDSGESRHLTVKPIMTDLVLGTYYLNITIFSNSNPSIQDEAVLTFHFVQKVSFLIEDLEKSIPPGGEAHYEIYVKKGLIDEYLFSIDGISNNLHSRLIQDKKVIINDEGSATVNFSGKEQILDFFVSAENTAGVIVQKTFVNISKKAGQPEFGISHLIIGTVITSGIAIAIAGPLGLGCAVFLAEYCPKRFRKVLRPLFDLLAGIPSVLYGLWGFLTLGPLLGEYVYPLFGMEPSLGRGIITASLILSIMILPIIIALSEDAIRSVKEGLKEGSLALGTTRWQTMRHIIIPRAKSGIIASIILGLGRAIGETMAVAMIMGGGTMTAAIALSFGYSYSQDLARHGLFAIALILFFMIFGLNIIVFFAQRERKLKFKNSKRNIFSKSLSKLLFFNFLVGSGISNDKEEKSFEIFSNKKISFLKKKPEKEEKKRKSKSEKIDEEFSVSSLKDNIKKVQKREKIIKILLIAGVIAITVVLFTIISDIIIRGGSNIQPEFFFEREFSGGRSGGYANAIVGSIYLVVLALAIAVPLSLATAIYINEYARKSNILTRIILFTSDTLASTPSIVFGAFGFMFFVVYLKFGFSLFAGGFTLAFMILPILIRSSLEALRSIPDSYREGALALGATKWKTITTAVLPPASPTITSGVILSMGRTIGETAAVLLTAGYTAIIVDSLFSPAASMPYLIFKYYIQAAKIPILAEKVYSAAMILIVIVLVLNLSAKYISIRQSKMMKE